MIFQFYFFFVFAGIIFFSLPPNKSTFKSTFTGTCCFFPILTAIIMSYYLAIIGPKDTPIYTLEFGTYRQGNDGLSKFPPEMKELSPFVLHSTLDIVEDVQWSTPALYLKAVDNFYAYMISAFVTAGNIKFLLLHESRNEEPIRQFFTDVYDLYVKALLSPFYFVNQTINSPIFDQKVRALAKKYL